MRTINDSHSLAEMPELAAMLEEFAPSIEKSRVDYVLEYTDGWEFEYFGWKSVITYFIGHNGKLQRHGLRRCEYSEEYFAEHYAQFEIDETAEEEEAEEEIAETAETIYMVSAWTETICTGSANGMSSAEEYRFTDGAEAYKFYEELVADTPSDYKREVASAGRLARNKQFCVDLWAGVQDEDGYWTSDAEGLEYYSYGWAELMAED
jgi:hypothetical protein